MRYVDGVLLEGRDILLADYLVRQGAEYLQRRNGGDLPPGAAALCERLAVFAGRETVAVVVSRERESGKAAAAVVVEDSRPAEMTAPAAAGLIGVSAQAVRGWCRDGTLLATKDAAGRWQVDAGSAAGMAARRKGS